MAALIYTAGKDWEVLGHVDDLRRQVRIARDNDIDSWTMFAAYEDGSSIWVDATQIVGIKELK